MCLYGVGGAAHPDELLARLTARQWAEWQTYLHHFPPPLARADLNAAAIRQSCGHWKTPPKLADLVPKYGRPARRRKKASELRDAGQAWAAAGAAGKGRP